MSAVDRRTGSRRDRGMAIIPTSALCGTGASSGSVAGAASAAATGPSSAGPPSRGRRSRDVPGGGVAHPG